MSASWSIWRKRACRCPDLWPAMIWWGSGVFRHAGSGESFFQDSCLSWRLTIRITVPVPFRSWLLWICGRLRWDRMRQSCWWNGSERDGDTRRWSLWCQDWWREIPCWIWRRGKRSRRFRRADCRQMPYCRCQTATGTESGPAGCNLWSSDDRDRKLFHLCGWTPQRASNLTSVFVKPVLKHSLRLLWHPRFTHLEVGC